MKLREDVLDNPVWNALKDIHSEHDIDYGQVKFYKTDFTPFGAFINNQDTSKAIEAHSKLIKEFFKREPKAAARIVENLIKGNKDFGITKGAVNPRIVASVLSLYDSERLTRPTINEKTVSYSDLDKKVAAGLKSADN